MVWVNDDCNGTSFPCLDVHWCRAFNQTTSFLRENHLCLVFVSEISYHLEVLGTSVLAEQGASVPWAMVLGKSPWCAWATSSVPEQSPVWTDVNNQSPNENQWVTEPRSALGTNRYIVLASLLWKYPSALHQHESRWKLNSTNGEASLEPFESELHLLHQLEHCTKGQIKVATPFSTLITYAWFL